MAPQIADRAIQVNNRKGDKAWTWVHALTEPDYRRTDKAARVVQVFIDALLLGRYRYLAEQVRNRSEIEPDDLLPGQVILMINRHCNKFAMLLPGHNVVFHALPKDNDRRLTLADFDEVARAFQTETGLEFDTPLRRFLLNHVEKRQEVDVQARSSRETGKLTSGEK